MNYIKQALDSNWVAPLGPNVDAFEQAMCDYLPIKSALALSSGTAALHLALKVLGVNASDTVFCSTLTFVASANAVLYCGARPVFIDSEPSTWNMSPTALEQALKIASQNNRLPKAVIVVNLFGESACYRKIRSVCDAFGVAIIEDAAESLGASYAKQKSGTWGDLAVFSFNGNKIITTSGGGMLVSDDVNLMDKARFLSAQAKLEAPFYLHNELGYNYRLSNVLAGLGRAQLDVLDERVLARRKVFARYRKALSNLSVLNWMPEGEESYSNRWLSVCLIKPENTELLPQNLITHLANLKIEARRIWNPMHRQPMFETEEYYKHHGFSFSDTLFQQGICLPSSSNLELKEQQRVIDAVQSFFQ